MNSIHPVRALLARRANGEAAGVYSACTANAHAIEAVCRAAQATGSLALVEATANQVNRYGGYTGMTPVQYADFVRGIAQRAGLPENQLILGGDHLGPLTWKALPEEAAMQHAHELIADYIAAGFTKIHIDTSMRLGSDDAHSPLADETIARRGAALAHTAQKARAAAGNPALIYCIGSEVPIPGGAQEAEDYVEVTSPDAFHAAVAAFRSAFVSAGAEDAWADVVGIVVQPGVEFFDTDVIAYDREKAQGLTAALKAYPSFVFEGHSTDYQTRHALRAMVRDGVAILKVGPALTFALREALFSLAQMEEALLPLYPALQSSAYRAVLDGAMTAAPAQWQKYYTGTDAEQAFKRRYSYSDRCRYYLPDPDVSRAEAVLFENLRRMQLPFSLLSQYMPEAYTAVREGTVELTPEALVRHRIGTCIGDYLFACGISA